MLGGGVIIAKDCSNSKQSVKNCLNMSGKAGGNPSVIAGLIFGILIGIHLDVSWYQDISKQNYLNIMGVNV